MPLATICRMTGGIHRCHQAESVVLPFPRHRTPIPTLQNAGLKSLSYQASGATAITGGPDTELLEEELAAQAAAGRPAHAAAGLVSLLVRPRIDIVSKDKLVASKGKLITVTGAQGCINVGWG